MFSDLLDRVVNQAGKIGQGPETSCRDLMSLLEKRAGGARLDWDETTTLLNGTRSTENRNALLEFAESNKRPHTDEVLLLPPLYFSSICENDCAYCDFSSHGLRLTPAQFLDEFNALLEMDYRSIELVSSQDPELYRHSEEFDVLDQRFHLQHVLPYFQLAGRRIKESGGGMLTSNVPPVDFRGFGQLREAGLNCYLIWLETFDPEQYKRLHVAKGPKSNQAFRLNSLEMAREAGVEHLAGAFLKGLQSWRKEEFGLYALDDYLKTRFGRGFSIIGTPRLKGRFAQSKLVKEYAVSDEDYELNIALDRILYDGILWLQTRESFETNRRLIKRFGGGVILTLTSSTAPGGYRRSFDTRAQFPVYKQELFSSVSELQALGCRVHFDWNSATLASFQRSNGGEQ